MSQIVIVHLDQLGQADLKSLQRRLKAVLNNDNTSRVILVTDITEDDYQREFNLNQFCENIGGANHHPRIEILTPYLMCCDKLPTDRMDHHKFMRNLHVLPGAQLHGITNQGALTRLKSEAGSSGGWLTHRNEFAYSDGFHQRLGALVKILAEQMDTPFNKILVFAKEDTFNSRLKAQMPEALRGMHKPAHFDSVDCQQGEQLIAIAAKIDRLAGTEQRGHWFREAGQALQRQSTWAKGSEAALLFFVLLYAASLATVEEINAHRPDGTQSVEGGTLYSAVGTILSAASTATALIIQQASSSYSKIMRAVWSPAGAAVSNNEGMTVPLATTGVSPPDIEAAQPEGEYEPVASRCCGR